MATGRKFVKMKTYENKLDEMIDAVVKLIWNHTMFCKFFEKRDDYTKARQWHPQFFITMWDSLLCTFCVTADLLFCDKVKATSLCNLIKDIQVSKPEIAKRLNEVIDNKRSLIKKVGVLRNQACAHLWAAKTRQAVFAEARMQLNMTKEIAELARLIVSELAEEAGGNRRENLENLKIDRGTLQFIQDDVTRVMNTFVETS